MKAININLVDLSDCVHVYKIGFKSDREIVIKNGNEYPFDVDVRIIINHDQYNNLKSVINAVD